MSLGRRVRDLREQLGVSQETLAEKIGVERSYISHIESGRTRLPSIDILRALSRELGASFEELVLAAGGQVIPPRQRTPRELATELLASLPSGIIPLALEAQETYIAAGEGGIPADARVAYIPTEHESGHRLLAFRVSGRCMEPEIYAGEYIIVDQDEEAKDDDLVAVAHDTVILVKRLKAISDGWLLTARDGTEIHPNEDTTIIGVVCHIQRKPTRRT